MELPDKIKKLYYNIVLAYDLELFWTALFKSNLKINLKEVKVKENDDE